MHDFLIKDTGRKAMPYGVYDLRATPAGSASGSTTTRRPSRCRRSGAGGRAMGRPLYPAARSLLITADGGGSNGARLRLWKWELQQLATRTRPGDHGVPLPSGNEQVEQDRAPAVLVHQPELAGQPLVSLAAIVSLIGSTHSRAGLHVRAEVDRGLVPSRRHRDGCAVGDPCASNAIASTAIGTIRSTRSKIRQ